MELVGEQALALQRESVWAALNDPAVLKQCLPGCESFERTAENVYNVVMTASVGPIKARFTGKMTLSDLDPPKAYALTFDGNGGAAGFGKGKASVNLDAEGPDTRLCYKVNAQVGGRLAQVGSRLIDGVARKMAEEFFQRFEKVVVPATPVSEGLAEAAAAGGVPSRKSTAIWVWAALALLVLIASFFAIK